MLLSIIVFSICIILMLICILKFPTIKIRGKQFDTFYLPILAGAIILLIFPTFNKQELFNVLFSNSKLNPLKILTLFISVSFISIVLDEAGLFAYIANKFINKFKYSQKALFFSLYFLISVLTIFTSNDIVILTFTPFILYFSKHGHISPIPYLVMEFVCANTYSILLPIGNPTNIYLTSIYSINFIDYVLKMIIPVILIGLITALFLPLLFRKQLAKEIEVFEGDEIKIKNKFICIVALIHLALTTIFLVIANYINLEMWIIAAVAALSLLIIMVIYALTKRNNTYLVGGIKRIPYSLIPFILSMFVLIMALKDQGVFSKLYTLIERVNSDSVKENIYLVFSTLSCNIFNNIPMTIACGSVLENATNMNYVFNAIIGSNLGALLTPVGALAGIMWLRILKDNDVKYSFLDFMKNGALILSPILITLIIYNFII